MPRSYQLAKAADLNSARRWFANAGIAAARIVPTQLGLKKGYFDAIEEVRQFLYLNSIHNFTLQGQGEKDKVIKTAYWLTGRQKGTR